MKTSFFKSILLSIISMTYIINSSPIQAEEQLQHRSWQKIKEDKNVVTIPLYCQDSSLAAISTLIRGNYGVDIREEHLLTILLEQYPDYNRICQDTPVPLLALQNLLLNFGFKLVAKTPESILKQVQKTLNNNTNVSTIKINKFKQKPLNPNNVQNQQDNDNQLNTPYITLLLRGKELDYVVVKGIYPQTQEVLFADPKNNQDNLILDVKTFQEYQNVIGRTLGNNYLSVLQEPVQKPKKSKESEELQKSEQSGNLANNNLANNNLANNNLANNNLIKDNNANDLFLYWEVIPLDYMYATLPANWSEKSKIFMSENILQKAHPTRWIHLTNPILPLAQ
jgi:hypothetical protein